MVVGANVVPAAAVSCLNLDIRKQDQNGDKEIKVFVFVSDEHQRETDMESSGKTQFI